jgi:hypothetical protein
MEDSKFAAEKCYEAQKEPGSFLSSAFVARDMVQIIDALDEDGMLRHWGMPQPQLFFLPCRELTIPRRLLRHSSWANVRSNVSRKSRSHAS